VTFIDLLRRLFGRASAPTRPPSRLTEAQAVAIAREVVGSTNPLYVQDVVQTDTGIEWLIGTATVGRGVTIRISDASGKVLESRSWGVR
jgi:hypothetical protein